MKFLAIFLSFFLGATAFTADIKSTYPLRGQGEYKWFFIHIYDAKLWGPKIDSEIYSRPFALELNYKRNFKGSDIVKQSEKEMQKAGVEVSLIEKWRGKLLEIFPDIKEGDTILASYDPQSGVKFSLNNSKELGSLDDLNFSKVFLDIWLGEKTSAPSLRNELLGKK